ncbi:MAG: insulinase family protein [Bacteroidota bacterium]|nr:insulinase family protein [Bacteroidota bacterium]
MKITIRSYIATLTLVIMSVVTMYAGGPGAKEISVDGIKVIFKQTPKEVISVRVFVRGGNATIPAEKQGLENFAFSLAAEGGTIKRNKDVFSTESEKTGTEISGGSTYDYGTMNLNCIKTYWNEAWGLFAEAITSPAFAQSEFDLKKGNLISAAKQNQSNPDQHLTNIAMESVFIGRSYSKIPEGTPESLEALTLADLKDHYSKAMVKSRIFVVVVGNVNEEDLIAKIKAAFAKLPAGSPAPAEPRVQITKPGIYIEDRDIATNYLIGIMSAPGMGSPEGVPMRIAMNILYDRFFVELRTKRSLSYAPSASYNATRISNPYNSIYISTLDPKQSIDVMVEEINKIKKEGFTEKELLDKKQTFLTRYFIGQETSAAQSQTLGLNELGGTWKNAESFTEDVNKTNLKEVNTVLAKYTGAIRWTYLGKKDAVKDEDFKQIWKGNVLQSPY